MDRLSAAEVLRLIDDGETETVEFKLEHERQPDVGELLVALANARGGTILIGVTDDGEIVGIPPASKTRIRNRWEAAARQAQPSLSEALQLYPLTVAGKVIMVAQLLPRTDTVYSYGGVFRQRVGAANLLLTDTALTELVLRRRGREVDAQPVAADLTDLDPAAIQPFLAGRLALASVTGDLLPSTSPLFPAPAALDLLAASQALRRSGATYQPTLAGLLLFGRHPQTWLPHAVVQCARFRGTTVDEFLDRLETGGPLGEQLRVVLAFIARNTPLAAQITGLEREDRPAYPPVAIREAVVNALMHRDYARRAKTTVNIFADRIEILSPGGLLPGLRADRLDGIHELRNHVLGQLMLWARLAETYGTGIRRMKAALAAAGLPPPVLEDGDVWFRVVLYGPPVGIPGAAAPAAPVETLTDPRRQGLNARQQALLRDLAPGAEITRAGYAARFGLSLPQAGRDLYDLAARGLLIRRGRARDTLYAVPWPTAAPPNEESRPS